VVHPRAASVRVGRANREVARHRPRVCTTGVGVLAVNFAAAI
jgi:hypothetical protein